METHATPVIPADLERVIRAGLAVATADTDATRVGVFWGVTSMIAKDANLQRVVADAPPVRQHILAGIARMHPTHGEQAESSIRSAMHVHEPRTMRASTKEDLIRNAFVACLVRTDAILVAMGPINAVDDVGKPTADADGGMTVRMPGCRHDDLLWMLAAAHAIVPDMHRAVEDAVRDRVGPWPERVDALIRLEDEHRTPGVLVSPHMRAIRTSDTVGTTTRRS